MQGKIILGSSLVWFEFTGEGRLCAPSPLPWTLLGWARGANKVGPIDGAQSLAKVVGRGCPDAFVLC